VVIGIAPDGDYVILRSGTERRRQSRARDFLRSWEMAGKWGVVVLSPGQMPASTTPWRLLAAVAQAEPMLSIASRKRAYRAALDRWPENITARFGYAHALHAAGELTAAESRYREIVNLYPRHAAALNNLAEVLADRGCHAKATAIARRALTIAAEDQPALVGPISETLHGLPTSGYDEHRCMQADGAFRGD
jgi:tetratricopeptide (TPR) repeat protein